MSMRTTHWRNRRNWLSLFAGFKLNRIITGGSMNVKWLGRRKFRIGLLPAVLLVFLLWQNWSVNAQTAHGLRSTWLAVTTDVNGAPLTVDGYDIYRGVASGQENTKIGSTASGVLTYLDTTGTGGTTYFYAISAFKGSIEGAKGAEGSGVFPQVPAKAGAVTVSQE